MALSLNGYQGFEGEKEKDAEREFTRFHNLFRNFSR